MLPDVESWSVVKPTPTPKASSIISGFGDDLAGQYSAVAEDATVDMKKREAAMLFALAESLLDNGESYEEAIQSALDCEKLFKEIGDNAASADALRLWVSSMRMKAEVLRADVDVRKRGEAKQILKDAAAGAESEMAAFKKRGDRRGEASMMLSTAEVNCSTRDPEMCRSAISSAKQAGDMFQEIGDLKMQGTALVCLANARLQIVTWAKGDVRKDGLEALAALNEALPLFKQAADQAGEGKCLLATAIAYAADGSRIGLEQADALAKDARTIFQTLGKRNLEAYITFQMAEWLMLSQNYRDAAIEAKDALDLYWSLDHPGKMEITALKLFVEASIAHQAYAEAQAAIEGAQKRFEESKNDVALATLQELLLNIHLAKEEEDDAMRLADKVIAAYKASKDKFSEARAQITASAIHADRENWTKAENLLKDGLAISNQIKDKVLKAEVMWAKSNVQLQKNEPELALESALESKQLFRDEGNRRGEACASIAIYTAQATLAKVWEAESAAYDAHRLFAKEGDLRARAYALELVAKLQRHNEQHEIAMRTAQKARAVLKDAGDLRGEARMLLEVAQCSLACWAKEYRDNLISQAPVNEKWQKGAMAAAKEVEDLGKRLSQNDLLAYARFWMGRSHIAGDNADDGLQVGVEALGMFEDDMNVSGQAATHLHIADAFFLMGKSAKAEESVNNAVQLAKVAGDKEGEALALDILNSLLGREISSPVAENVAASGAVEAAPAGLDEELVKARLMEVAGNAMGFADDLTLDAPLMDAGMDSLAAVEFRNMLTKEFVGINMPASLTFDFPTLSAITENLVEQSKALPGSALSMFRSS